LSTVIPDFPALPSPGDQPITRAISGMVPGLRLSDWT
jgi:hypothetical protein